MLVHVLMLRPILLGGFENPYYQDYVFTVRRYDSMHDMLHAENEIGFYMLFITD